MSFVLCPLDTLIENQARSFRSPVGEVIVIQRDNQVYAWQNICPHLGLNLEFNPNEFMDSDNHFLICSNHGALFNVEDGLCVSGPCQGDSLLPVSIEVIGNEIRLLATDEVNKS